MNFGELQTEFYSRGFDYMEDSTASQTRAKRWLNQAYLELCEMYDWPFLEASTTGTSNITISDLGKVLSVIDSTNYTVVPYLDRREVLRISTDLTTTGVASVWYLEGSTTLKTYPVSTSTLTIRYISVPTELSSSSDSPVVPARFQDLIVDGAVIKAYKDNDDAQAAAALRQEYDRSLQVMINSLLNRDHGTGDFIQLRGLW